MTGRPVLATPRSRGRTRETVLHGAPVASGTAVILGWDHNGHPVTIELARASREWAEDLMQATVDARCAAGQAVTG